MATTSDKNAQNEERLDAVVLRYLQAQKTGTSLPREHLLAEHPDLAAELSEFFADQDRLERLAAPLRLLSAVPPVLGQQVGDYEVLDMIAQGGMGVVYRARQRSLNRVVALKMIRAGLWAGPLEQLRFKSEAEHIAALDHPNIVPVHDVGQWEGRSFFSMKLIEGGNLGAWLKEVAARENAAHAAPDWNKRATILAQVARAIHYAHQRGLLHRDLKPANILIDTQEQPHVTDFGLAKRLGPVGDTPSHQLTPDTDRLTQSGAILGTPSYLAPELAQGAAATATIASDIYGLGAILYEMLTGQPPFRGADPLHTLAQLRDTAPARPRHLDPRIPLDLETICLKAMQKEPSQRYVTALSLADDLTRFVAGEPIHARRVGTVGRLRAWARRQPILASLTGGLLFSVVAGAALFAWQWQRAEREAEAAAFNERAAKEQAAAAEHLAAEEKKQAQAAAKSEAEAKKQAEAADVSFKLAHDAITDVCDQLSKGVPTDPPAVRKVRRDALELALSYYERLLDLHAADPRRREDLARTHFRIATTRAALGNSEKAIEAYQKALGLQKELAAALPAKVDVRADLARMWHRLAFLRSSTNRPAEAIAAYQESERLFETLVNEHADQRLQAEFADLCMDLGGWHRSQGLLDKALAYFERSRDIFLKLVSRPEPDVRLLSLLADTYFDIATVHQGVERYNLCDEYYEKALELRQRLYCSNPRLVRFIRSLAESYRRRGGDLLEAGKLDLSFDDLNNEHQLLEWLVALDPSPPNSRSALADSKRQLGHLYRETKDYRQALALYSAARDLGEVLVRDDPSVAEYQNDLAKSLFDMATVHAAEKKPDLAYAMFARSALVRRKVVEGNPDHAGFRADLAFSLFNTGITEWNMGKRDAGIAHLIESRNERRRVFDRAPAVIDHRNALYDASFVLTQMHRMLGQWDEALACCIERRELWPKNGKRLFEVAREIGRSANLLPKDVDAKVRQRFLDEAVATLRQAIHLGWRDAASLKHADFAGLSERDDFQMLLRELAGGTP